MPKPQWTREEIVEIIKDTAKNIFTSRFIADVPTDDLQLANRRYINLNGAIAKRPKGARTGQQYYATDLNKPIFFSGNNWRDSTSSVVAGSL